MKKLFYIFVLSLVLVSLSACNKEQAESQGIDTVDEGLQLTNENDSESKTQKNRISIKKDSTPFGAYDITLDGNEITGIVVNNSDERAKWQICFDTFDEKGESNTGSFLASGGDFWEFLEPGEEETFSITVKEGTVSFSFEKMNIKTETDLILAEAENLILYGDYAEATVMLNSILETKPDNIEVKRLLARIEDAQNEANIDE